MIERLVTDLPEPDSPTSARVSPGAMVRSRSCTAATSRSPIRKTVLRPEISRIGSACMASARKPGGSDDRFDLRGSPRR